MEDADTVRKAMAAAGLEDAISSFNHADLLNLYAGGYRTAISFKYAREQDLKACGILPGLIGLFFRGARVQGELLIIRGDRA